MPASRQHCADQLARFRRYHGFPDATTDDGRLELADMVDALQTCATDAHAERAAMRLLRSTRFCPTVAEIVEAVRETEIAGEAPTKQERRDPNCPTCHGTGWQIADSAGHPWTIDREMSEPQTEWRARRCSRGCIPRGGEANRTEAA